MAKQRGSGRTYRLYADTFKQQVVREYQNGYNLHYLQRKYEILGNSTIKRWLLEHGLVPIPRKNYLSKVKPQPTSGPSGTQGGDQSMEQQLKALQEQLLDAQLRAEMLERMIEIAEQDHQISIRKKGATK